MRVRTNTERTLGHQPRGGHRGSQCQCIDVKTMGYGRLGIGIGCLSLHGHLVGEEDSLGLDFGGHPGSAELLPRLQGVVHRSHHHGAEV